MIYWNDELVEKEIKRIMEALNINRMPSNSECIKITKSTALSNRIRRDGGFYMVANRLGLEIKNSETKLGKSYEKIISQSIKNIGYNVKQMEFRHPYDLLVNDSVKIDIKVAKPYKNKSERFHTFNIEKKYATCDLYIAICLNEYEEVEKLLVIPSKFLQITQLSIGKESKYDVFKDKWIYLDQFIEFHSNILI